MSDFGMFVEWGEPIAGREHQGIAVFKEALDYVERQEQEGTLEDHEVVILSPHGNNMQGFILMRGEPEKLNAIVGDPEWGRIVTRAGYVAHNVGVVPAYLNHEGVKLVEAMESETTDLRP